MFDAGRNQTADDVDFNWCGDYPGFELKSVSWPHLDEDDLLRI
jgi:hypothetical protein